MVRANSTLLPFNVLLAFTFPSLIPFHPIMAAPEGSFIAQRLTPSNIFSAVLIYLAVSIVVSFIRAPKYPTNVPWVGHGKGWLSAFRNVFDGLASSKHWVQEGYEKYTKSDKAFVMVYPPIYELLV
jgi:hypothetical protein